MLSNLLANAFIHFAAKKWGHVLNPHRLFILFYNCSMPPQTLGTIPVFSKKQTCTSSQISNGALMEAITHAGTGFLPDESCKLAAYSRAHPS